MASLYEKFFGKAPPLSGKSKFEQEAQNVPKPQYFKASDNELPPTLRELGLDKAMNGEK